MNGQRNWEEKNAKRNKRKIPPPLLFLFPCSFSSFSSTPHYNTAFVVVSASNLHVTQRVEYGERRHWLRGKPVGGARTPHSLSASRGWKRGDKIKKKRERERQFWRNASLEELQFFVLNFCWKFSSFIPPPPPLFDSWMLITSLKPTLQGILRFWRSKHGSISLFFCYPSLFIYIFFHCRNEVANKPVVHSVITNALGILFLFFFLLEFSFLFIFLHVLYRVIFREQ